MYQKQVHQLRTLNLGLGVAAIIFGVWQFESSFLAEVELLLLFGIGIITPLSLGLSIQSDRTGQLSPFYLWIYRFQSLAILGVSAALFLDVGWLAIVWLLQTSLMALWGLYRLLPRPVWALEELCIDLGLIYSPVSGVWLLAYSTGYALFDFDLNLVLLTAVHFTYISLGALMIAGMIGRILHAKRLYQIAAMGMIISPWLVAAGITLTQMANQLFLEVGSSLVLAFSLLSLSSLVASNAFPTQKNSRYLLLISLSVPALTMLLAVAYPLGRFTGWWSLSLATMVRWHGWFNAFGFVFLGLLAFNLETPAPKVVLHGIPFSHLIGHWKIGADFFERLHAIDDTATPTGIVDRMSHFQQSGFKVESLPPNIIAFYEQTASHHLVVYPEWRAFFLPLARVYKMFSRSIGQMNFPLGAESNEMQISSHIVGINSPLDGREAARGWIRSYTAMDEAVYVAAYACHQYEGRVYMNIAFPLPYGQISSILSLRTSETDSLLLSSFSQRYEDQGVYFFNPSLPAMRLPINEVIHVFANKEGGVQAEHKMWIFGIHFLTLHYSIYPNTQIS